MSETVAQPHAHTVDEVLDALDSERSGLTRAEAARRLALYGPSELVRVPPPSALRILWDQVRSTVVVLLVVAAGVGMLLGDTTEAIAILAVLLVNVAIGFTTEWRARTAMEALRRADVHRARVLRDGQELRVDARMLVPGDVLDLDPGEAVTADARVIEACELRVVEAALTGESRSESKTSTPNAPDTVLADRTSMVFKGTMVAAGTGRAVVAATGSATEIGRIGQLVAASETEDTPLELRLAVLGRQLVWISLGIAALVAGLGFIRGQDPWLMLRTGIALAIAAVPEGLPIVATICLSLGMRRMARRRALIRRLPAVETLGCVTVICTDKTGTLTAAEMTVTEVCTAGRSISISGSGYVPEGQFAIDGAVTSASSDGALLACLRIGALANEATLREDTGSWRATGDPTEIALLVAARKGGLARDDLEREWTEFAEIPFSSDRMWMASARRTPRGEGQLFVKGAPLRVLARCSRWIGPAAESGLSDVGRTALRGVADRMAARGLRVLALASRRCDGHGPVTADDVDDLVLAGFVGISDPPAAGAREAVRALRGAGVRPVMITGDHRLTAVAVAREIGIAEGEDEAVDGADLERLDDAALAAAAARATVFSRVSPEGKLRIVAALRSRGEIVGMLGDGVNDAPALKRADIGVAMGVRGTDVAKETAALVLQDDRFATVVAAVEEGRVIFDNIRKFIFFLFSCNLSEVALLCCFAAAGLPLPLLPLQILWLNFVTDVFPALALAAEPREKDVLRRPPRDPDEAVLSPAFVRSLAWHAALLTASAAAAFGAALLFTDVERARTIAFMAVAFGQTLHALNARSPRPILLGRSTPPNPWMWGAIGLVAALQAASLAVPPIRQILGLVTLGAADWTVVAAASVIPLVVGQTARALRLRRNG